MIVSNDKNNENSEVVEVVYMTTKPKNDLLSARFRFPGMCFRYNKFHRVSWFCSFLSSLSESLLLYFAGVRVNLYSDIVPPFFEGCGSCGSTS